MLIIDIHLVRSETAVRLDKRITLFHRLKIRATGLTS